MRSLRTCFLVSLFSSVCFGYNILGIFHTPSRAQFEIGATLLTELASRGHNVTMISPFHLESPVSSYNEIILDGISIGNEDLLEKFRCLKSKNFFQRLFGFYESGKIMLSNVLQNKRFQNFIKTKNNFDLIVFDATMDKTVFALAQFCNASVLEVDTIGHRTKVYDLNGLPVSLYSPFFKEPEGPIAGLGSRMLEVLSYVFELLYVKYVHAPRVGELSRQYLPPQISKLDLPRNVPALHVSRASSVGTNVFQIMSNFLPNQVSPSRKLTEWLNSMGKNIIYVSLDLGNIRLTNETIGEIIKTLGSREETILWNSYSKTHPGLPKNIKMIDVDPTELLLSSHVKLAIIEGERRDVAAAMLNGIPIIALTEFLDQLHNLVPAVEADFAVEMDLHSVNEAYFGTLIEVMLSDTTYKNKAEAYAKYLRDQKTGAEEMRAIWIEYLIKAQNESPFKVAPKNILQQFNIDIIVVFIVVSTVSIYVFSVLTKKALVLAILFYLNMNVKEKQM